MPSSATSSRQSGCRSPISSTTSTATKPRSPSVDKTAATRSCSGTQSSTRPRSFRTRSRPCCPWSYRSSGLTGQRPWSQSSPESRRARKPPSPHELSLPRLQPAFPPAALGDSWETQSMGVGRDLAAAIGAFLIVLTAWSVIGTVVVPRRIRSRLPRAVAIAVDAIFHYVADHFDSYEPRDRILAAEAPIQLIMQTVVWLAVFEVGFALLLWPLVGDVGLAGAFE